MVVIYYVSSMYCKIKPLAYMVWTGLNSFYLNHTSLEYILH